MEVEKLYILPTISYEYNALSPHISEELLKLHHGKHHAAYVKGANAILQKMDNARTAGTDFDPKATFNPSYSSPSSRDVRGAVAARVFD